MQKFRHKAHQIILVSFLEELANLKQQYFFMGVSHNRKVWEGGGAQKIFLNHAHFCRLPQVAIPLSLGYMPLDSEDLLPP